MSLNPNPTIRCRSQLANYYQQRIKWIGFVKDSNHNYVTSQADHALRNSNALFIDVHGITTVHDNPNEDSEVNLELDHIHARLKDQQLNQESQEMVTFTADVYRYPAKYKGKTEYRYGLTNIMIINNDAQSTHILNQRYTGKLTISERMLLRTITKQLPNKYPNYQLYAVNTLSQKLLTIKNIHDRTSFLVSTADLAIGHHILPDKKLNFFMKKIKTGVGIHD